jgi:hypothetical protein
MNVSSASSAPSLHLDLAAAAAARTAPPAPPAVSAPLDSDGDHDGDHGPAKQVDVKA